MVAWVHTVAFNGIEVLSVDVQVQISAGLPAFTIVGLADKAVVESRERVRACFQALALDIPPRRITVNLAPADLQKEGSHFDLPIALGLMIALKIMDQEDLISFLVMGELALDGSLGYTTGTLLAAIEAGNQNRGLICPANCAREAMWAGDVDILAAPTLISLVNHFKGTQLLSASPTQLFLENTHSFPDFKDIKGQKLAKRALEITAAGGHNLLMIGPPGAGKSMLASRLPGILPPLTPQESLNVTMIHSLAGCLPREGLVRFPPFRDPHHSASVPALIGGGHKCKPGEVSLAHHGVLFLDELPEFQRSALEALRQPLETGKAVIARANSHVTFPAQFQLIAAMNPCRCGYYGDPNRSCSRIPQCAQDYQSKISGPMMDRFDIVIDVPEVPAHDLLSPHNSESSSTIALRIIRARHLQHGRYQDFSPTPLLNARIDSEILQKVVHLKDETQHLLLNALQKFKISGRGYHRVLRVARTIADLNDSDHIDQNHLAEALSFRRMTFN